MATPTAQVIVLQAQGQTGQVYDLSSAHSVRGQALRIKVQSGVRYQLKMVGQEAASAPKSVKVNRAGKDLRITIGEGELSSEVVLEGYFEVVPDGFSGVVGQSDNGSFYEYLVDGGDTGQSLSSLIDSQQSFAAVLGSAEVSFGSGVSWLSLAQSV
jgi:hypothetical protein